ncbi:MAG: phenylalanine--tRNA ligase subunit beta, partial [Candidatus Omnitrophica bacterium]|nr:phenylalanine--tRNA ligase subunit beta [Candidatus Omnitrophota bacterium]
KQVESAGILALIRQTGTPLAVRVELIDRFTDHPSIPPAKHSLTVSIEYRDPGRTLTAAEVDVLHRQIGEALSRQFGAQLR